MGWTRLVWVLLGILWWIGRSKRVGRPAPRPPQAPEESQGDQPVSSVERPYGVRPTDQGPGCGPRPDESVPPEEVGTGPHLEPSTAEGWPQRWEDESAPASDPEAASSTEDSQGPGGTAGSAASPAAPDSAGSPGSADSPDSAASPSSAG